MGHLHFSHAISPNYYPIWTLSTASCDWCTLGFLLLGFLPGTYSPAPSQRPVVYQQHNLASLLYLGLRRPCYDTRPYLQCTICAIR